MKKFLQALTPDAYAESIYAITKESLQKKGIKGVIVDLDNTLVAWRLGVPNDRLADWIKELKDAGISLCINSNNTGARVDLFAKEYDIPAVPRAAKPRRSGFYQAMELMGTDTKNTVVIGDQIFTDVLGGNRLGLLTILVVPISSKEFIGTRMVRMVEKSVLKALTKNGLLKDWE